MSRRTKITILIAASILSLSSCYKVYRYGLEQSTGDESSRGPWYIQFGPLDYIHQAQTDSLFYNQVHDKWQNLADELRDRMQDTTLRYWEMMITLEDTTKSGANTYLEVDSLDIRTPLVPITGLDALEYIRKCDTLLIKSRMHVLHRVVVEPIGLPKSIPKRLLVSFLLNTREAETHSLVESLHIQATYRRITDAFVRENLK